MQAFDNLYDETIFFRPTKRISIPLSISIQFHEPLKRFIDSVEKIVIHTALLLGLHPIVVFWTNPVHSTGHPRGFDDASRDHRRCALRAGLACLHGIFVFAKAGPRGLT